MPRIAFSLALALAMAAANGALGQSAMSGQPLSKDVTVMTDHPYVGMWVTKDGHVRQELLPNGRYDEARGDRRSAYQGRYEVRGNKIDYWDDTGFTADGEFIDDVLHHGGMLFYRKVEVKPHR
ncbi:Atu4866 domain-containing protein [Microvirga calopogonii]|uniref:Atu4866 domain-containing protein n=1 Tax=Microvirga calopogonii TaxID=2078013 RepID=UPI000E0D9935|nr:Atu4866 domain-containing protein [Microvirga calopogonii]